MMAHLEQVWQLPDDGIWEIRGPQRHFTQSKVMAWVAFDRAAKMCELRGTHRAADREVAQARRPGQGRGLREGLQRREEQLRAVLRLGPARLEPADAGARRVPPADRPADHRHRRGDPARAHGRRLRAALPDLGRRRRRRAPGRRGHVPHDDVLAGGQPRADRPPRRGARAVREAAEPAERRRHAVGGVRPEHQAADRQLPAGVLPPRPDRLGVAPVRVAPVAAGRPASTTEASS